MKRILGCQIISISIVLMYSILTIVLPIEHTIVVNNNAKYLLGNTPKASDNQIVYEGGSNQYVDGVDVWQRDGVQVSKTIDGTDKEDYFDITLQIKTRQDIQQIVSNERIAVVIVADLSNTMKAGIDGSDLCPNSTRYWTGSSYVTSCVKDEITDSIFKKMKAGKTALEIQKIVQTFADNSVGISGNEIGVVGFNTDGFGLQEMKDLSNYNVNTFKNNVYTNILDKMKSYKAMDDPTIYTNIEAGLTMAKQWLSTRSQKHKYVIFLSDGLPTTYLKDNQTCADANSCLGLDARDHDGIQSQLIDEIRNRRTQYGSNYSDTGAARARQVAMDLKENGVNILSVGVGLNTFTGTRSSSLSGITFGGDNVVTKLNGEQMIVNQIHRSFLIKVSTVENNFSATTFDKALNKKWELLRKFDHLSATNYFWNGSNAQWYKRDGEIKLSKDYNTSKNDKLFEKWLQYGIGSGKFWDVTNDTGLISAMNEIRDELVQMLNRISRLWVTSDPMGTVQAVGLESYIDFIGFVKSDDSIVQILNGGNDVNSATFGTSNEHPNGYINWDLKNSRYTKEGNIYTYQLKYRVRLKTEKQGFESEKAYDTNDKTTLSYALDINNILSEDRTIDYPIPKVKGFLTEIKVLKMVEGLAPEYNDIGFSDTNKSFEFKVTFKTTDNQQVKNTFTYDKYNADGSVASANQTISHEETFTLQDGQYVIIHNLFHDIKWNVSETNKDGFVSTITKGNNSGTTATAIKLNEVYYNNKAYYLNMKKVDSENNELLLKDVRFSLYTTHDNGIFSGAVTNMNGVLLQDKLTDKDGMINLGNLAFPIGGSATYYLVEEETIDKYNLLENYIELKVDANGITAKYDGTDMTLEQNGNMFLVTVPNAKGIDLPETGGHGSLLFKLIGVLTMLLSGIAYTINKRMENN